MDTAEIKKEIWKKYNGYFRCSRQEAYQIIDEALALKKLKEVE